MAGCRDSRKLRFGARLLMRMAISSMARSALQALAFPLCWQGRNSQRDLVIVARRRHLPPRLAVDSSRSLSGLKAESESRSSELLSDPLQNSRSITKVRLKAGWKLRKQKMNSADHEAVRASNRHHRESVLRPHAPANQRSPTEAESLSPAVPECSCVPQLPACDGHHPM